MGSGIGLRSSSLVAGALISKPPDQPKTICFLGEPITRENVGVQSGQEVVIDGLWKTGEENGNGVA